MVVHLTKTLGNEITMKAMSNLLQPNEFVVQKKQHIDELQQWWWDQTEPTSFGAEALVRL